MRTLWASMLLGLLAVGSAQATSLVMPELEATWIAQDMTLNGLPVSMRALKGSVPASRVLAYYRKRWGKRLLQRRDRGWHLLAAEEGGKFVSLRLRPVGGGVEGVLTVSPKPDEHVGSVASDFPVPNGLTRLSRQTFNDRGVRGENLTLMSPRSVAFEREAFTSRLLAEGWRVDYERAAASVPNGHIGYFSKARRSATVLVYRDAELGNGNTFIYVSTFEN